MAIDRTLAALRSSTECQKTFEHLRKEGEMSPAAIALSEGMLLLMKLMIALFLEKTTKKTNRNSGLPSSQVDKDETSKERSGSTGKGPGQEKTATDNTRFVTVDDTVTVEACEHCGEDLTSTPSCACEKRVQIDIVFETVEHHVTAEIKHCPRCGARTTGRFPETMTGPFSYGPGIQAFLVNLLVTHMVSLKRASRMMKTMTGRLIAEATL